MPESRKRRKKKKSRGEKDRENEGLASQASCARFPAGTRFLLCRPVDLATVDGSFTDICDQVCQSFADVLDIKMHPDGLLFCLRPRDEACLARFASGPPRDVSGVRIFPAILELSSLHPGPPSSSEDSCSDLDSDLERLAKDGEVNNSSIFSSRKPPAHVPVQPAPAKPTGSKPVAKPARPAKMAAAVKPAAAPVVPSKPVAAATPPVAGTSQLPTPASGVGKPVPASLPAPEESMDTNSTFPPTDLSLSGPDESPEVPPTFAEVTSGKRRSRRGRTVFKGVDFTKVDVQVVPPEKCLTVLFRPVDKQADLRKANPKRVNSCLHALAPTIAVRPIRGGGLAVDFPLSLDPVRASVVVELDGIPVTASVPSLAKQQAGILSGVHPDLTDQELLEELAGQQVTSVRRLAKPGSSSWVCKLTFAGELPERLTLFSRSLRVRPYTQKPLQCLKCMNYGHGVGVCRSSAPRCRICSGAHDASKCDNTVARCSCCGGPHPADDRSCPARAFQVKVVEVQSSTQVPFKAARLAVVKAARSYAAAARREATNSPPTNNNISPTAVPVTQPAAAKPTQEPGKRPSRGQYARAAEVFTAFAGLFAAAVESGDFSQVLPQLAVLLGVPYTPPQA